MIELQVVDVVFDDKLNVKKCFFLFHNIVTAMQYKLPPGSL